MKYTYILNTYYIFSTKLDRICFFFLNAYFEIYGEYYLHAFLDLYNSSKNFEINDVHNIIFE